MRARFESQLEARRLREEGRTLREIADLVDASLSSVSVWVRGVDHASSLESAQPAAAEESPAPRLFAEAPLPMRRCRKCGLELLLSEFSKEREGLQKWCKSCWRIYARSHRDAMRAAADARRARATWLVKQIKVAGACSDCQLRDPDCLEFDHVGEKTGNIGALIAARIGVDRLEEELRRCELVCACCHRRRTIARRGPRAPSRHDRGRDRNQRLTRLWASLLGCVDCGERDPDVLEYDHVGTKTENVATLSAHGVRVGRLFEEMLRCDVRCANCHRRRHASERRRGAQ